MVCECWQRGYQIKAIHAWIFPVLSLAIEAERTKRLPFSVHFQVPHPVSPLLATLAQTAGGWEHSSQFGKHGSGRPRELAFLFKFFLFKSLRTLLLLPKTQLSCFHVLPHSLRKNIGGWGYRHRPFLSLSSFSYNRPAPCGTPQIHRPCGRKIKMAVPRCANEWSSVADGVAWSGELSKAGPLGFA